MAADLLSRRLGAALYLVATGGLVAIVARAIQGTTQIGRGSSRGSEPSSAACRLKADNKGERYGKKDKRRVDGREVADLYLGDAPSPIRSVGAPGRTQRDPSGGL